jgi:transcriptional regulator with XRE-family HTH domain
MNGDQLRKTLEKMGMSQGELAREIGVRPETVYRWIKGKHPIPCATAKLIYSISLQTVAQNGAGDIASHLQ